MTAYRRDLPMPFAPAEIEPALARLLNAAAARGPASLALGGSAVGVSVMPAAAMAPDAVRIDLSVGAEACVLMVPPGLLAAAGLPGAGPDPALSALLLECALAEALGWMEGQLGATLALDSVSFDAALPGATGLRVVRGGEAFACLLRLGPVALSTLSAAIERRPPRPALSAVPVQLCLRAGVTELAFADLLTLAPGDAVLIEETGLAEGQIVVVAGERLAASAARSAEGVTLAARPSPAGADLFRRWCMKDGVTDGFDDPVDGELAELRVTLVFELGRRMATLSEIAALGPGSVVETGGGPDQSVDVLANGRRIGRGTIVSVGGSLAVQLQRIGPPA